MKTGIVPPGRLDVLTHEMLKAGLKANKDPILRIAEKMMEQKIRQALTETIGPGTKAGDFAIKAISAVDEFKKRYLEAQAQIRAEDGD
jgi:hypothetical protein